MSRHFIAAALLLAITAIATEPLIASSSRFDRDSSTLFIPCLALFDDGQPASDDDGFSAYSLELFYDGEFLWPGIASPIQAAEDCSASFDISTQSLVDEIRLDDVTYALTLLLGSGNYFSIEEAIELGYAETSLWRISDGTNELFIGGTVHLLRLSDYPLPVKFYEAYLQAAILVTEIAAADLVDTSADNSLLYYDDGSSLSSRLGELTYIALDLHLQLYGSSASNYEQLKINWMAAVLTNNAFKRHGFGQGVDQSFRDLAQFEGKPNLGLETYASQLLAINSTNSHLSDDAVILNALIAANSIYLPSSLDRFIRAWREGDIDYLLSVSITPPKAANIDDYNTIYTHRNAAWIPQIEAFLATPELELILVGVGHLVGPESVLQMLRDLGYEVQRY